MNFKALLTLTAIVAGVAGLGFLFSPAAMQQFFGVGLERATASADVARLLGAYMLSFAIVFWAMRGISAVETKASLAKAISATFVLGTVVAVVLQVNQAMGAIGWAVVAIYGVFTLAYAYIGFGKGAAAA